MTDKDTFGDKLHDKGKTDEDRYIREQERKRREQREAARRAAGEASGPDSAEKKETAERGSGQTGSKA